jgi:hypothetical protein
VNSKRVAGALLLCPLLLAALTGCGTVRELIGSPATRTPTPPPQISEPTYATPQQQGPKSVADFVGTWSDPNENWTVRFTADGAFASDYQGVQDFRNGTFQVHNDRLDLIGADGEVDSGRIKGDVVEFRLGTLSRVQ